MFILPYCCRDTTTTTPPPTYHYYYHCPTTTTLAGVSLSSSISLCRPISTSLSTLLHRRSTVPPSSSCREETPPPPSACLPARVCLCFVPRHALRHNATSYSLVRGVCSLPLASTLSPDIFPVTFSLSIASSTPRIYTFVLVEPFHSTLVVSSLFPSLYSGYTLLLFYTRGGCGVVPANPHVCSSRYS